MKNDKNIGVTGFGDLAAAKGARLLNLEWLAKVVAHETLTKQLTERIRGGDVDAKKRMRCVLFHSVFNGRRCKANAVRLTGYLCLDFDDEGVNYEALRNELAKDEVLQPVLMFSSPRGKLKCAVYVPELDGVCGDEMEQRFSEWYVAVCVYVRRVYGILPDPSCLDISRNCFLSHDDNPYLNLDGCVDGKLFDKAKSMENSLAFARYISEENNDTVAAGTRFRIGVFNDKAKNKYLLQLRAYRAMLVVGDDGDYIYNRKKRVFVGSRHEGTAKVEVDGLSGYELKWRILEVAYWLYGDKVTAQRWVESHFSDALDKRNWTPINDSNTRITPKISVLRWVLRVFGFEMKKQ